MTASPSIVVYQGKIWVLHQGNENNNQLWYNVFDGKRWAGDVFVPNVGVSSGPSMVVWQSRLFVFHHSIAGNNELWYSVWTGSQWLQDAYV